MQNVLIGNTEDTDGVPGRGCTSSPKPKMIPFPPWLILGHELCGHAVSGLRHPTDQRWYTQDDPVIKIENMIRKEHSCPESCKDPRRVDWGERGLFDGDQPYYPPGISSR